MQQSYGHVMEKAMLTEVKAKNAPSNTTAEHDMFS
jgi:hypothetical protein